jgi:hypothetical protein
MNLLKFNFELGFSPLQRGHVNSLDELLEMSSSMWALQMFSLQQVNRMGFWKISLQ